MNILVTNIDWDTDNKTLARSLPRLVLLLGFEGTGNDAELKEIRKLLIRSFGVPFRGAVLNDTDAPSGRVKIRAIERNTGKPMTCPVVFARN